jgi:hypothetical protein
VQSSSALWATPRSSLESYSFQIRVGFPVYLHDLAMYLWDMVNGHVSTSTWPCIHVQVASALTFIPAQFSPNESLTQHSSLVTLPPRKFCPSKTTDPLRRAVSERSNVNSPGRCWLLQTGFMAELWLHRWVRSLD